MWSFNAIQDSDQDVYPPIPDPSLQLKWWLTMWLACNASSSISAICNLPQFIARMCPLQGQPHPVY